MKKLVFAVETLPVNLVVSGLVSECFLILLFSVFLLAARGGLPLSLVWLPLVVVPQILFTAGVSWFVAALGVFVRDLAQLDLLPGVVAALTVRAAFRLQPHLCTGAELSRDPA